jgi:hypothetical protein
MSRIVNIHLNLVLPVKHSFFLARKYQKANRSVQKVLPIQRIPLRRPESRIADDAPQLFFCRAVRHACGSYYVFFQHD